MNTLRFSTRQQMRTFVKRVNLCTGKKLYKTTGGKDGCGSWLANKVLITNTLQSPSKSAKLKIVALSSEGRLIIVTHKRSVRARMSLKA